MQRSEWVLVRQSFEVRNGLRQGCTLAPTLFNIYFCAITGELRTGSGKWCDHTLIGVITLLGLHPVERAPLTNVWNAIL